MESQDIKPFVLSGYEYKVEREKSFEVKRTVIDIKINFEEKAIEGKVELDVVMNSLPRTSVEIDAVDMNIYNVSVKGVPVKFETFPEKVIIYNEFKPFGKYIFTITYKAYPRRGGFFVDTAEGRQFWTQGEDMDNHGWFPCFDYPNTRSSYEIRVTVPKGYMVISNGLLVQEVEGEVKTFIYKEDFRFPTYLVSVIAGKFKEMKQEWQGVPIISYFPANLEKEAQLAFQNTPDMMEFLSSKTGVKYPYEKYSQTCVAEFVFGGMENLSATTLTERTLHDKTAHLDYQSESLVCHELAHQWFGDYVTCKDWSQAWLNEGFATYMALIYRERYRGTDEFLVEVQKHKEIYLREFSEDYGRPIVEHRYKDPAELFDRHLYQKASLVLRYLNYYLGDEIFWKGVKYYLETNKESGDSSEDFRKALSHASGFSLEGVFHQFINEPGHPEFKVKEVTSKGRTKLRITQAGKIYDLRVPIRIYFEDRVEESEVEIKSEVNEFEFERRGLKGISVDPESKVLKVMDFDRPKEEVRYVLGNGRSVLERAEAAIELSKFGASEIEFLEGSFFEEKFWYVKGKIADAVARIGGDAAINSLLKFLDTDDYDSRREVVKASGKLRSRIIFDKLVGMFQKETGYFIRAEIITAAQKNGNELSVDLLNKGLNTDSYDDVVRIAALNAMAEIGDVSLLPVIKKYYGKEYNWMIRATAIRAIGKLYWKDRSLGKFLLDAMEDGFFAVRLSVADSLKEIGDANLINSLGKYLSKEPDGRTRRAIREAMEFRGFPPNEKIKGLQEQIEKIKERITELEGKIKSKK